MDDARYGDLDTCADCGAPLADTDSWLCSTCMTARDDAAGAQMAGLCATDAPHGHCDTCGAALSPYEPAVCDHCTALAYWQADPSGFGVWRDHQMEHQSAYSLPAAIVLIATMLAGMVLYAGWQDAQADDTGALVASRPINGYIYQWPAIGTPEYSRSCEIIAFWEDGSARAYCMEDGALYSFSPEEYEWRVVVNNA